MSRWCIERKKEAEFRWAIFFAKSSNQIYRQENMNVTLIRNWTARPSQPNKKREKRRKEEKKANSQTSFVKELWSQCSDKAAMRLNRKHFPRFSKMRSSKWLWPTLYIVDGTHIYAQVYFQWIAHRQSIGGWFRLNLSVSISVSFLYYIPSASAYTMTNETHEVYHPSSLKSP